MKTYREIMDESETVVCDHCGDHEMLWKCGDEQLCWNCYNAPVSDDDNESYLEICKQRNTL